MSNERQPLDQQPANPAPADGGKPWDKLTAEEQAARRVEFWKQRGQNANVERNRGK